MAAPERSSCLAAAAPTSHLPVSAAETLRGEPGIVDLWCYHYGKEPAVEMAEAELLAEDERARCERLRFARDRRMFVATRALARTVLSEYADVAPREWLFAREQRGRPYVRSPSVSPRLHFNLSNTSGLVVCAIAVAHAAVGVDVEDRSARGDVTELSECGLSVEERAALGRLPPDQRWARFLQYWTLRESYFKALGVGLGGALEDFRFVLHDESGVRAKFAPCSGEDANAWRFALVEACPAHTIAVGVHTGGAPLSLRVTEYVPLGRNERPR